MCVRKGKGIGFVGSLEGLTIAQHEVLGFVLRESYDSGAELHNVGTRGAAEQAGELAYGIGYRVVVHPQKGREIDEAEDRECFSYVVHSTEAAKEVVEACALLVLAFRKGDPEKSPEWDAWNHARAFGRARMGILSNGQIYVGDGGTDG